MNEYQDQRIVQHQPQSSSHETEGFISVETNRLRKMRSPKSIRSPYEHQGMLCEWEPIPGGRVSTATLFLTGSECRYTCSMCDLWQYTLEGPRHQKTPTGALVAQLDVALEEIRVQTPKVEWLKLYNAANFFDPMNVPVEDLEKIAVRCRSFSRIVVENHAQLSRAPSIMDRMLEFRSSQGGELEVAMGLESIEPVSLSLLNKGMTLDDFAAATRQLVAHDIPVRAFVLLQPPGVRPDESVRWAIDACQFAWGCGVTHCSIIPTRRGSSGWLAELESLGKWTSPNAAQLELALKGALAMAKPYQLVTVDLWDWDNVRGQCPICSAARRNALHTSVLQQQMMDLPSCDQCL